MFPGVYLIDTAQEIWLRMENIVSGTVPLIANFRDRLSGKTHPAPLTPFYSGYTKASHDPRVCSYS